MRTRITRYAPVLLTALVLFALTPLGTRAQYSVLNRFNPTTGTDNILEINGTIELDDKVSNWDHATATVVGTKLITTNLSSVATCTFGLKVGAPGDDPTQVTGLWTTGSANLELQVWKTSGTDPTLIPSAATSYVGWACFGSP